MGITIVVLLMCGRVWIHLGERRSTRVGIGVVTVYSALGVAGMLAALIASPVSDGLAIGAFFWVAIAMTSMIVIRGMLRVRDLDATDHRGMADVFE